MLLFLRMKISVLIDNSPNPENNQILTEHGLSFYFEADGRKWMMDCGASDKFLENAEKLGINVADVDFLILSHAHSDHTGGIAGFLSVNSKAKIYLSAHISKGVSYYSTRRGGKRNISIDYSFVERHFNRFVCVDKNCFLTEHVLLISDIPSNHPQPKGNQTLLANDCLDDFRHEMALVINLPEGAIVISSCCHKGILNTLRACKKTKIAAYIGGTHLLDGSTEFRFETADEIRRIAQGIQSEFSGIKLITGHCTGQDAATIFRETMQSDFRFFHSGEMLEI